MFAGGSFDIVIAGGGPAGSAAALALLKNKYNVLIVESSYYKEWRVGEFLWPKISHHLSQLGVPDWLVVKGHCPCHSIQSAWGSDILLDQFFIFDPYGDGHVLDRKYFDAKFAQIAENAGATILRGTKITSMKRSESCWNLTIKQPNGYQQVHATFLIDATGRARTLMRKLGRKWYSYDEEVALVGILSKSKHVRAAPAVLLIESVENGWWYSLPLPNGSLLVAFLTDAKYLVKSNNSLAYFWQTELAKSRHTQLNANGYHLNQKIRVKQASTGRLDRVSGPGWIALGDSASTCDPLTGSGISKAVQYAIIAGQLLEKKATINTDLNVYADMVTRDFDSYIQQRADFYRVERRWSTAPFWAHRQADPMPRANLKKR